MRHISLLLRAIHSYRNICAVSYIQYGKINAATVISPFSLENLNRKHNNKLDSSVIMQLTFLVRKFSKGLINCWNCQKSTKLKNNFFCDNCGSLQNPIKEVNYFELFSFDQNSDINLNELTKKFRYMQSLIHPDKFSNRHEIEQQNSLEWSSLINKAYKTLSLPMSRGEYILELHGIIIPEDNTSLDKEFLMEMMERNEEVEDAHDKNAIFKLLEKIQKDIQHLGTELQELLNTKKYEDAKLILIKMKYFQSLEKSIKDKAVKLGAVK